MRNTAQLLAGNYEGSDGQNAALDLSLNENNVTRESVDNESCCSSLHVEEIIDSDEEDIAELDEISDLKRNTAKQFNEFTDLIVDRMDSCEQMRKAECEYKNLELAKNVKKVEA